MTKKENLLPFLLDFLTDKDDFVFLWNGRVDKDNFRSYIFTAPVKFICCFDEKHVFDAILEIENVLQKGYYVAGFMSYEAGFCFEDIAPLDSVIGNNSDFQNFPLLWFGVYEEPIVYDHKNECFCNSENLEERLARYVPPKGKFHRIENIEANIEREDYIQDILSIKDAIARGDTYQVNYTFKHKFDFDGDVKSLFLNLCMKQSVSYAAFIRSMDKDIISLSPELFFRREGNEIVVKPMKGTIERGIDNDGDRSKADELHNSIKNRAENVMIVDLLRNDLGRISKMGSVKVEKLYEVEKYETLFQMTSTIRSVLEDNISWVDIFRKIFPSGSITGAPKIITMRIINSLEKEPRRIYTGSIGYIAPDNNSVFNVVIRTILLDRANNHGEMGIGSGIVYDSDPELEFEECLLKADFLTSEYLDFQLIETMLWQKGRFYLLELHLNRLEESSKYFQFHYDKNYVLQILEKESKKFQHDEKFKVRLLLHKSGLATVSSTKLDDDVSSGIKRVIFSPIKTEQNNRFLYHKTTNRDLYNTEFERARSLGYYDILFTNRKNEVTEGAISNIFIKNKNKFYTPPIKSGLLNGVFRQHMFEQNLPLEEKALFKEDIFNAEEVYLTNSVRGMVKVFFEEG